jgi:transposase
MTCAAAATPRAGRTPVMRVNHKRAGLGLISAVSNKGELRWMVLDGAIKAAILISFLTRLMRDAGRKVFLILDRLAVHRSAKVKDWLAGREAEIEVFYLPPYSPELNPDEGLNGDLKQAVTRKAPARSKHSSSAASSDTCASCQSRPHGSAASSVNILRQSRRLYGCGPLKGAFSQPTMVQESAAAQTRAMRAQTAKNILPEMSNSDSHPGRAGGSPWGNRMHYL